MHILSLKKVYGLFDISALLLQLFKQFADNACANM